MATAIAVLGAEEVARKLKELEPKIAKKVLKRGLRAGCKIVRKAAQARAPIKTGRMRKAIKVRAGKTKKGFISIRVAVGKNWFGEGSEFYGAFQEFGWHPGKRGSRAKDAVEGRKWKEGDHFIEEAYKATAQQAKNEAMQIILKGIEAEAK